MQKKHTISSRFRGMLPVVVDIETSGLNPATDAILEIAAIPIKMSEMGRATQDGIISFHVEPFLGARIDSEALSVNGIIPDCALRYAIPEQQALHQLFQHVKERLDQAECQRAILVGHNAWFDLAFIQAAIKRCGLLSPFHSFTTIDTASLAAIAVGETVLARAARALNISFNVNLAHSAIYDAQKTAELFCRLVNGLKMEKPFP